MIGRGGFCDRLAIKTPMYINPPSLFNSDRLAIKTPIYVNPLSLFDHIKKGGFTEIIDVIS
jgi:hypothetical protein